MKIGNPAEKPPGIAPVNGHAAEPARSQAQALNSAATPDASAQVQLSSTAASLLAGGASAEFDADKVARISAAIADGSFKVNADAIADKLLANAQELLSQARR
jgi:negative regulator of flagellin synthesis FlgM